MTKKPTPPVLLLADDDNGILDTATELLEHAGYAVVTAPSGGKAMDVLQEGLVPDAIILDLMMPIVSGWDVWDWLQAHPKLARIPVIIWTATGLSQGAVGHARVVQKGKPENLLVALGEALSRNGLMTTG